MRGRPAGYHSTTSDPSGTQSSLPLYPHEPSSVPKAKKLPLSAGGAFVSGGQAAAALVLGAQLQLVCVLAALPYGAYLMVARSGPVPGPALPPVT